MTSALDIERLIAELTLEEKASLCSGSDFWHTQGIEHRGIPAVMVTDGPHGLRKQAESADHLGIGNSVPATCFPTAAALASSWDPELLEKIGVALGEECLAEQVAVILGPGINIKRSPLGGRNFEYFSEDPHLAGELAAALVAGVQSQGVGTSLKHYAVNNQETDRLRVSADVDERTLREIYLPAFETVVTRSAPWTVMCSYNRVNGVYASQDPWLLTKVLREDWGYEGMVVSDWGAVDDRVAGLAAGMDLEMPGSGGDTDAQIVAAVRAGALDEAIVDQAVRRVLGMVAKALPALAEAREAGYAYDVEAHHGLARRAAGASAVLLRNEGGVLPLDLPEGRTLAVVGAFASEPRYQGAGSSQVNPTRLDTLLEELREATGDTPVMYEPGFSTETDEVDPEAIASAVAAAREADAVVVCCGLPARYESEGWDRASTALPANQLALLEALTDAREDLVVVLCNGGVVDLEPFCERVGAILECWLPGQAGAGAIADILTGAVNPSGRLPETIGRRRVDEPAYLNFPGEKGHVRHGEGVFVGYRGYDAADREVRYPFGHGLSYTTFAYADLAVEVVGADAVRVRFTVTNTGDVAGAEVAQVYVADAEAAVPRPVRELKGFAKVHLAPGETGEVTIDLDARAFSYWDTDLGDWKLEGGHFGVEVGASVRDIRLSADVQLPDDGRRPPLRPGSTIGEWLADPRGAAALAPMLTQATAGLGEMDEGMTAMMASMPMDRVARMPGLGPDPAQLAALYEAAGVATED